MAKAKRRIEPNSEEEGAITCSMILGMIGGLLSVHRQVINEKFDMRDVRPVEREEVHEGVRLHVDRVEVEMGSGLYAVEVRRLKTRRELDVA